MLNKVFLLFFLLSSLYISESRLYLDVRAKECDWECEIEDQRGHGADEADISECCKNTGYEGPSECDDSGRAFCSVPDMRKQKSNVQDLESKLRVAEGSLQQCKEEHKKYIESMGKAKAVIEGLLSAKKNE